MRYVAAVLALALAGCANGPAAKALASYNACLDARGVEGCQTEKARLDAALGYANAQSRRIQALGSVPVITPYTAPPPVRQPINCTTIGSQTTCY